LSYPNPVTVQSLLQNFCCGSRTIDYRKNFPVYMGFIILLVVLVTGGIFAIEPMMETLLLPSWNEGLNQWLPKTTRQRVSRWASVVALMVASFLAFDDVNLRNRELQKEAQQVTSERDEARRQRDANVSPIIDRMSGDLTAARARIDAQKKQIDQQETKINAQRAELEKVEQQQAPRRLSAEQQRTLINALSPFPGQKIRISALMGNTESIDLANDFVFVVREASWDDDTGMVLYMPAGPPLTGVEMIMNTEVRDAGVPPAARALVDALIQVGILSGRNIRVKPEVPSGTIILNVGVKPPVPN
jgi:hypothetical protein